MTDPETSIAGFASALDRIYQQPDEISRLSKGALRRAKELTWDAKVGSIVAAYEEVISREDCCGEVDEYLSTDPLLVEK